MALRTILDLPENLKDERNYFQTLFDLGTAKTTSGNLSFTSTTSAKVYNTVGTIYANGGQVGMQALLFNGDASTPSNPKLIDYMAVGDDFTEIKNNIATNASSISSLSSTKLDKTNFSKYVSATQLDKSDATLADIPNLAFPVVAGKTYKIETFAKYQTGATTTGIKFYSYLPTGAGTIIGNNHVYFNATLSGSADVLIGVVAIGASGLTGSGLTTPSVGDINTDLYLYSNLVFKCTSNGEFRQQFASEVATIARLMAGATMLVSEV